MAAISNVDFSALPARLYSSGHRGEHYPRPKGGGNKMAVQAPVKGKKGWISCSKHEIHYREELAKCPMCDQDRQLMGALLKVRELENVIDLLKRDKHALEARLSHLDAMRMALDLIGDEDRVAIKEVIYRYQRGEPINSGIRQEKFTSKNGAGVRHVVSGFKVDVDVYHCTSVGGVAMARAFSEATKLIGRDGAADMLMKAMAPHLAPVRGGDS